MSISAPEVRPITDIYVVNPAATNGNGSHGLPEGITPFNTVADRGDNINGLLERMSDPEQDYRVHICGGDGTVSWAVAAAVLAGSNVTLCLKKGGYKNDVATMVEQAGGELELTPLLLEKYNEGKGWTPERIVTYSYGLGAVAVGAKIVNSKEFRDEKAVWTEKLSHNRLFGRWATKIADLGLVKRLLQPKTKIEGEEVPTTVEIDGRPAGALLVSNGQWMSGGWMRFGQQRLEDPGYVVSRSGANPASKLHGMLWRAAGGLHPKLHKLHPASDVRKIASSTQFDVRGNTLMQADGEDFVADEGKYRISELSGVVVKLAIEE